MKSPLFVALFIPLFLCGCAANAGTGVLRFRVTAPQMDDAGQACSAPVLVPPTSSQVWLHLVWTGPQSGRDSVLVNRGAVYDTSLLVPTGVYVRVAYAGNGAVVSCQVSDQYTVTAPAAPSLVQ